MMKMMMDESYRTDTSPSMFPGVDLDSTWSVGESAQNGIRVKPPALSTGRLQVFRQTTRGAVLSILETGHVSIEFLKRKGDRPSVVELFVVSGDGQTICVEQYKADGISDFKADTEDIDKTWKTLTYNSLPEKYWKRYSHACKFVDLVKSKTAKVTMYSDRAKGILMENWPPNFEATFFQGPKIVMCGNEIHIQEENGVSLLLHRDSLNTLVNSYTMGLIQHATQLKEQCLRLEASVMTVQTMSQNNEVLFPVTVGMRPSTSFCSSTSSNSGSMDFLSSPRFNHLHSSASSSSQGQSASPPSSPSPQINLRCLDTSSRQTPALNSSPTSLIGKTPQSPLRHISTLEGRKLRRQLSDSTDSSFHHQHTSSVMAAYTNPDLCCRASPPYTQQSPEQNSCSTANCGFMNSFSGGEKRGRHGFPSEMPEAISHSNQLFIVPSVMSASPQMTPLLNTALRNSTAKAEMPSTSLPGEEQWRIFAKDGDINTGSKATTDIKVAATSCFACCETQSMSSSLSSSSSCPLKKTAASKDLLDESSAMVRQTFVAYTGWASQHANGTIWVRYNEGTQLGVNPDLLQVLYVDQQGCRHRYIQSDDIPEVVRQKLEKLPTVIENLKRQPTASPYTLAST